MMQEEIIEAMLEYVNDKRNLLLKELSSTRTLKRKLEDFIAISKKREKESEKKIDKNAIEISQAKIKWKDEIIKIMQERYGPMTKSMIREELAKKFCFIPAQAYMR